MNKTKVSIPVQALIELDRALFDALYRWPKDPSNIENEGDSFRKPISLKEDSEVNAHVSITRDRDHLKKMRHYLNEFVEKGDDALEPFTKHCTPPRCD